MTGDVDHYEEKQNSRCGRATLRVCVRAPAGYFINRDGEGELGAETSGEGVGF